MSEKVQSFSVRELLIDHNQYLVPMYQRNYAWGEGEIHQLIQDVQDYQKKTQSNESRQTYYIGTLVVYKRNDGRFEVIDGQQRFTTLTLLAICLKRLPTKLIPADQMNWYQKPNLNFESRPKSSETISGLIQGKDIFKLKDSSYNSDVVNGFELLEKALLRLGEGLSDFCQYLFDHVQIARVPVPKDTDLNHYFEVMNSRGEQLEKHEVVKARLLSVFNEIENKVLRDESVYILTRVWDATANMERYVQYGFSPKERHGLFGQNDWGQFIPCDYNGLVEHIRAPKVGELSNEGKVSYSMQHMLDVSPAFVQSTESMQSPQRFNSVINFSNFLLHVLRVWSGKDIALDDKQLLEQFEQHILKTVNPVDQTKSFVFALLKCKFLFDQYIIKREMVEDKWSLKRLHFYNPNSQSYLNTFDQDKEDGFEDRNRRILMLLSAMHVSTPTSVYKHWLNGALHILYKMQEEIQFDCYLKGLERMARQFVFGRFLSISEGAEYYQMIYEEFEYSPISAEQLAGMAGLKYGQIENNFVFNYLDYLLWCKSAESKSPELVKQFEFSFRSSVEHFYPQHPMDGHTVLNDRVLHRFGNLCLISHSKNSLLSNYQPTAKREHFAAAIAQKKIDSLKLYRMIETLEKGLAWGEVQIARHESEMLTLLAEDSLV